MPLVYTLDASVVLICNQTGTHGRSGPVSSNLPLIFIIIVSTGVNSAPDYIRKVGIGNADGVVTNQVHQGGSKS
jgi:hypothetical protein